MKRTHATALVLVNWRGVFYERYLLDKNVTALEGANGAGKTTVLIAAYLVLLPDMSRVRFTTVAEHAGTGGDRGVWGRLGQPGRPSYAVMEFRLPHNERLLAGVHLERRGEPAVDLTAFLITDIADSIALQEIMLERSDVDSVLELSQLREQVARFGGRLYTYSTAKEYFGALFDYGVMPLRLASDEERTKFNELLRTSMMGGISRALTTDLRGFLLREESGLADTLIRMRANLDACKRTRTEVEESRKLEHEISAVYEAGHEMFAAAVHATRERERELQDRVLSDQALVHEFEHRVSELVRKFAETSLKHNSLTSELTKSRQALQSAQEHLRLLDQARVLLRRIRDREAELAEAARVLEEAESAQSSVRRIHDAARKDRDKSQLDRERAAAGLADLKRGLEELERRTAEHQLVIENFAKAKDVYTALEPQHDCVIQAIDDLERMRTDANSAYISVDRSLSIAKEKRNEHRQVLAALHVIRKEHVPPEKAFDCGREVLAYLRRLETEANEAEHLPSEIHKVAKLADQQKQVREMAVRVETPEMSLRSRREVEQAFAVSQSELDNLESQRRHEERSIDDAERVLHTQHERIKALEIASIRWKEITAACHSLEAEWECTIRTRDDIISLRSRIIEHRDALRAAAEKSESKRTGLHQELLGLEQSGGIFSSELLRIRDAVEGELLAGQFEEVNADEAPAVQALLGPLAEAIVVDDPASACAAIVKIGEKPNSVWLVGGDATLDLDEQGRPFGEILDGSVVVRSASSGWRVTSFPERPTLGRRARERRMAKVRQEEEAVVLELDQHRKALHQLEATFAISDQLLAGADALKQGDPSSELENSHQIALDATQNIGQHRELRSKYEAGIESLRPICDELRKLLPIAWVLDDPDYDARAEELRRQLQAAKLASITLSEIRLHRLLVEEKLDVLRRPPPSEAEVVKLTEQRVNLQQQQEDLARTLMSLRYVDEHLAALDWTDAKDALRREARLIPALQEQLEGAKNAASTAQARLDDEEKALQSATTTVNDAYAKTKSIDESLHRDREEWLQLGIEDARDEAVSAAKSQISGWEADISNLESQASELFKQLSQVELLQSQTDAELVSARKQLEDAQSAWKPEQERWQRLRASAESSGVLAGTLTSRFMEEFPGQGSPNLRSRAKEHAATLKERLAGAREAEQVQAVVKELLGSQELSGEMYLQAWLEVRNWLRRRMPAQIAEVDEPLEALKRLKEHLVLLESRLQRQETELRGESEDVARNIDIHIRRAQKQVKRLNLDLEQARFGSIQGVHLHLQRTEHMDQVLSALREGQAQELLFKPEMPIEEALEEIFRRYAGGRSGGQKLLDYREYLDPKVTVKRKGSEEWEVVNPTRLSTGEGIGIGAAVMMVVLASWERDANLLRPKRSDGTLRLLFLDEANRLDKDNLGVLFDLCQNLELQLIVAAPEVARAEGNTTYRLVRRISSNGLIEVIVTGRRAATGASA